MIIDGTLGPLLQGVSQQPAVIRQDGKLTEQVNFISDVVQGLTSRPAVKHTADIPQPHPDLKFFDVQLAGTRYTIGYKAGVLVAWDAAGTVFPVTFQDADASAYIGTDLRAYVYDDTLYITNRDRVVATKAAPPAASTAFFVGTVVSLGGIFSRKYTITIRYADGVEVLGEYTTPDGTAAGDAAATSTSTIISALRTSLLANPLIRVNTFVRTKPNLSTLNVEYTETFTLAVDDGEDNVSLRGYVDSVPDITLLSNTDAHGHLVRVTGANGGEDDYWLRFNSAITNTIKAGLGSEGVWEEWYNPAEITELDPKTMPHVLRKSGSTFVCERAAWQPRRVGDSTTNPLPNFIGHPVRDIAGFQSRLVFVAGPWAYMSRTDIPTDFFKESALAEVDTDPIGMSSTKEGDMRLDWIIPFDRDLVFMSDPGAGQFLVTGNSKLTPDNAGMVMTTAFEMQGGAKPVQTGRTIVFPFKTGVFSGMNEFSTNSDVATNGVQNVTETLDRYISGLVDHITVSANLSLLLLKTDGPAQDTVWVYKYMWAGTDKVQSSWSKWVFPLPVRHMYISGSKVHLVLYNSARAEYVLGAMDLDRPADSVAGYHICLDDRRDNIIRGAAVTLPFADAVFVQGAGSAAPGTRVFPVDVVAQPGDLWDYTFDDLVLPPAATVVAGRPFLRIAQPTMPVPRDRSGNVIPRAAIVVTEFFVTYADTGDFWCRMSSPYRADSSLPLDILPVDLDPLDTTGRGMQSGVFEMPWGERGDWSQLHIESDDIHPTTIIEVQWAGQPFKP